MYVCVCLRINNHLAYSCILFCLFYMIGGKFLILCFRRKNNKLAPPRSPIVPKSIHEKRKIYIYIYILPTCYFLFLFLFFLLLCPVGALSLAFV